MSYPNPNGGYPPGRAPDQNGYPPSGRAPERNGYTSPGRAPEQNGYTSPGRAPEHNGYAPPGYPLEHAASYVPGREAEHGAPHAGPSSRESQYPPLPEEEDRARAYHQRMPSTGSSVTLPGMAQYDQHAQYPAQMNGYHGQPDPRQYADPYRGPPPPANYRDERGYPQEYGQQSGPPQPMAFSQPAPRQRTAIACKYCRKRKIRCSGFDQNPDGRCANCVRFHQDCVFTPVSSTAQAFVPAHAVYPQMRNMGIGPDGRTRPLPQAQFYGAHGQPLHSAPVAAVSPYSNEYGQSSPTNTYNSFTDDRSAQGSAPPENSRRRRHPDPHPAILPPPMPGQPPYPRSESRGSRHQGDEDLRLPPVTPTPGAQGNTLNSPTNSSTSETSSLLPPQPSAHSSRTPPPRTSPGEGGRADPMSLGNIMERRPATTEIDRGMLGRLGRNGPQGSPGNS